MFGENGDIDVESAEDVPDIGVEATAHTINSNGDIYEVNRYRVRVQILVDINTSYKLIQLTNCHGNYPL